MKTLARLSLTTALCLLALGNTGSPAAYALQDLPDELLSEVSGQDGLSMTVSSSLLTATGLAWTDDSTKLTVDNLKLQTKTGSPFTYTATVDAGTNASNEPAIGLRINQALTRQFLGSDGWHVGAAVGRTGGFGAEFQGTLDTSMVIKGVAPGFSGAFNLVLNNTDFYYVEDARQLALQSSSFTFSIPAWSAAITLASGITVTIPSASLLLASTATFRSGGTAYSTAGTTTAFTLDSRLDLNTASLNVVGSGGAAGGGLGTQGLKLALASNITNTSYLRLTEDGNTWRADSISGSINLPRVTLDVATGPDRLQINIGDIAAPGVAGKTASANIYAGNINLNGGTRALGLMLDVGNFDAALSLRPGGSSADGLSGDLQWRSNNGYVRFYDEAGAQYLTWGAILNQGTAAGWNIDLTATGLRFNAPSVVGDFNIGSTTVNASGLAWASKVHYDMGLDLTLKPGGASGQGLGLDSIWTINSPGTTTSVEYSDGTDNYGFYAIGGKITSTGGSIDIVNDNDGGFLASPTARLKFILPTNVTDASNISRIGSIRMGGADMGSMQFNNFKTYLAVDMWAH